MKKVQDLDKELQQAEAKLKTAEEQRKVLEEQLQQDVSSFCILPFKPSHSVSDRKSEVSKIAEQSHGLRNTNTEGSLTSMYISGNPGCGKSQLARLVGKQVYDEATEDPSATTFVMTLNAESSETLLESYISFARQVKTSEYTVTNTINSKEMQVEQKITCLRSLIATKIQLYTTWLIIVDNVMNVTSTHAYLPQQGSEQWGNGQLLITTQDTSSIPPANCFIAHLSISKGMEPTDANLLLATISGINIGEIEGNVAKALDYQPLALASAATYVKEVRLSKVSPNFSWKDYLRKLAEGKRQKTEEILTKTNPSYPKSMTTAITLAVKRAMESDKVIEHTFSLLSICSSQPLHLEILINYILNVDKDQDKEEISIKIRACSLLLLEEEESVVFIRLHQAVHAVIKTTVKNQSNSQHQYSVVTAVVAFSQFIQQNLPKEWEDQDFIVSSKQLVPHLETLIVPFENRFATAKTTHKADSNSAVNILIYCKLLGRICQHHFKFQTASKYYNVAYQVLKNSGMADDLQTAEVANYLGLVNYDLGNMQQAKKYHECALAIRLKLLGYNHAGAANSYSNLCAVYCALGNLQQAKEHHERALAIRLKRFDGEDVDVANSHNNLGEAYRLLGDLQQAKKHHERALTILVKIFGHEHVYVSYSYNNLSTVLAHLGDIQQAKQHLERALEIILKQLGHENVVVATCYNNLGEAHCLLGNLEQAKHCHEHALTIRLIQLGPEHVNVAHSYSSLGIVHRYLGNLQQAKQHLEHALAIFVKTLGHEHLFVALSYQQLAMVHLCMGDLQQVLQYHECFQRSREHVNEPSHINLEQHADDGNSSRSWTWCTIL